MCFCLEIKCIFALCVCCKACFSIQEKLHIMASTMATLTFDPPHRFVLKLVTNALRKHHETKSAPHGLRLKTLCRRACAHRIPRFFCTTSLRRCLKNGTSGIDLRYAERNCMEYVASIPKHYETCHPKSPITLLVLPRSTPGGFRLCRLIITWKPLPNCAFSGFACMQIDLQSESRPSKPVSAPKASRTKKHWCHCRWPWAPVIVFNRLITSRQSASKDEPFWGISWNFPIFHILSMSLQL